MNNLELSFLLLSCHHHVIIPILINRSFLFLFLFFLTYLFGRHLQLAGAVGTYFTATPVQVNYTQQHKRQQTLTAKLTQKTKERKQPKSKYLPTKLLGALSHSLTTFSTLADAFR